MECKRPQKGECYRHFKGNEYEVLAIAKHSETLEEMVVYQALYGEGDVYVRPLEMFKSRIDKEKYPDIDQEYRFQLIEAQPEEKQSLLLTFLDLQTATEKIQFLQTKRDDLTEDFIGLAAQCMEFVENKNDFEERYYDFIRYLRTLERFEGSRKV